MRQFPWRHTWYRHYQSHYEDSKFEPKCRHGSFTSLLELQLHLHDRHGVRIPEISRQCGQGKRRRPEIAEPYFRRNCKRRKACSDNEEEQETTCVFLNSTVDSIASNLVEQRSAKLSVRTPSPPAGFDCAPIFDSGCSVYPDIDLVNSDAASGPYYTLSDEPKPGPTDQGSQRIPTPDFISDAEFIDIDDCSVDLGDNLESAALITEIEKIDLTGRVKIGELADMVSELIQDRR